MSFENEIWFIKIISQIDSSPPPYIFQCKKTKIEMPFEIDETKIRIYAETQFPKWIDGEKYHLISQRTWGLGKRMGLYIHENGESFVIESTH